MIILQALASLALRFALAIPFWRFGQDRWDGLLELKPATVQVYEGYTLTLLEQLKLVAPAPPLPFPDYFAWAGSFAEIILPAALVIGFATRLSAFGLLAMTILLFMVNPAGWSHETLPWAAMALGLIAYGPGLFSFDRLIWSSFRGQ